MFGTGAASTTFILDQAAANNANITLGGTTESGGNAALALNNSTVTIPQGSLFEPTFLTINGNAGSKFINDGVVDQPGFGSSTTFVAPMVQGDAGLLISRGTMSFLRDSNLRGIVRTTGNIRFAGNATHLAENRIEGTGSVQVSDFGAPDVVTFNANGGFNLTGAGSRLDVFGNGVVNILSENKALMPNLQLNGAGTRFTLRTSPSATRQARFRGIMNVLGLDFTPARPASAQSSLESVGASDFFAGGDGAIEGTHLITQRFEHTGGGGALTLDGGSIVEAATAKFNPGSRVLEGSAGGGSMTFTTSISREPSQGSPIRRSSIRLSRSAWTATWMWAPISRRR